VISGGGVAGPGAYEDIVRALGADGYLAKPIGLELLSRVSKISHRWVCLQRRAGRMPPNGTHRPLVTDHEIDRLREMGAPE